METEMVVKGALAVLVLTLCFVAVDSYLRKRANRP